MNVLLINGSPHAHGCTDAALQEIAKTLNADGIETTIYHIGAVPVGGCVGCGGCAKAGHCVFGGPVVDVLPLVEKADGIVFGAPVHYSTAAASMLGFMHRLGYSAGRLLAQKPAAIVTSARCAGTTSALEALEKVPQFCQMPLISSTYWPMVHGSNAEQAALDEEGMQIMRNLGHNMAWILKCIAAGKAAGIELPRQKIPSAPISSADFVVAVGQGALTPPQPRPVAYYKTCAEPHL